MEVLNRGEEMAKRSLSRQLPKHKAALDKEAPEILARAFRLADEPPVAGTASVLVLRGFVGTHRLRQYPFAFVDERLLKRRLNEMTSLEELACWCRAMPYLPLPGKNFAIKEVAVRSRSGIELVYYDAVYR